MFSIIACISILSNLNFHFAQSKPEYDRIKECENAQEIWNRLKTTHKGTNQAKDSKVDVENSDDDFSEEDEQELAFLTKRVQRLLRRRKGPRRNFLRKDF